MKRRLCMETLETLDTRVFSKTTHTRIHSCRWDVGRHLAIQPSAAARQNQGARLQLPEKTLRNLPHLPSQRGLGNPRFTREREREKEREIWQRRPRATNYNSRLSESSCARQRFHSMAPRTHLHSHLTGRSQVVSQLDSRRKKSSMCGFRTVSGRVSATWRFQRVESLRCRLSEESIRRPNSSRGSGPRRICVLVNLRPCKPDSTIPQSPRERHRHGAQDSN